MHLQRSESDLISITSPSTITRAILSHQPPLLFTPILQTRSGRSCRSATEGIPSTGESGRLNSGRLVLPLLTGNVRLLGYGGLIDPLGGCRAQLSLNVSVSTQKCESRFDPPSMTSYISDAISGAGTRPLKCSASIASFPQTSRGLLPRGAHVKMSVEEIALP